MLLTNYTQNYALPNTFLGSLIQLLLLKLSGMLLLASTAGYFVGILEPFFYNFV